MPGIILSRVLQVLGLVGLPTDFSWWWHVGFPGMGSLIITIAALWREASLPTAMLYLFVAYVLLFLLGVPLRNWYARLHTGSTNSNPAVNIERVEGDVHLQQPPTSSPPSEPEALTPRYREDETVHIADLAREIRSGKEVVCHWTFKNCRIVGPAALFVHEPKAPRTYIDCEWTEGEKAFAVMSPEDYQNKEMLVGLHHCCLLGCRFSQVEIVVAQETYQRYTQGEINL